MTSPDPLLGWDEDGNAEAYAAFTRNFPMYGATSRDLACRAALTESHLVVDLCGGTGATAEAILALAPAQTRVISLDSAAAMQRIGCRTLTDPRLSWLTAPAEELAEHLPSQSVDAVVCNAAIWKTNVSLVCDAVHRVLRPGGRFVFNVSGPFAGVTHPDDEANGDTEVSLSALIHQIAARDYGHTSPPVAGNKSPKLPLTAITKHLAAAGLSLIDAEVTAQHSTMAAKKAWLSIPVFSRPEDEFTREQRMQMLNKAYAQTIPDAPTVTSWLIVTAQRPPQ